MPECIKYTPAYMMKATGGDVKACQFARISPGREARRKRRIMERAAAKARKRGGC